MTGARHRNSMVENAVWLQMIRRGVITGLSTNTRALRPVLRFYPPLTVERQEIDITIEAFHDSLRELSRLPSLVYDLANEAIKIQYHLPRFVLRGVARLLAPGRAPG
jgi:putrescine aminotransferase